MEARMLQQELDFYERHQWALQPFQSFAALLQKMQKLAADYTGDQPDWQKQEWILNLHLLGCASADILDDYLTSGVRDWSKVEDYVAALGGVVRLIRRSSELYCSTIKQWRDRPLSRWRHAWGEFLIFLAQSLVDHPVPGADLAAEVQSRLHTLSRQPFPARLQRMRLRIPAAYRSQDLTHHDIIALGEKYLESLPPAGGACLVVGLRTAGSYFAPMLAGYLRSRGLQTSYVTMRPKSYIHPRDRKLFTVNTRGKDRILFVDEPVGTGKTVLKAIAMLAGFGVKPGQMVILIPSHPANGQWLDETMRIQLGEVQALTLEPPEWFKRKRLALPEIERAIAPYFQAPALVTVRVRESEETGRINQALSLNPEGAFHVRLKKVVDVDLERPGGGNRTTLRLLIKSVGWGWYSYHAALAGARLQEFVPEVFGVRDGLMYCRWLETGPGTKDSPEEKEAFVQRISDYIAARATRLRLEEDPARFISSYRESGLQSVAIVLSRVFGPQISILKRGWVRRKLEQLECPVPALIDGRMGRSEWVGDPRERRKADFEHHGFSKTASHNIADPAYDLASAIVEFGISGDRQEAFINNYIDKSGDREIRRRLIYYQIYCGSEGMEIASGQLSRMEYAAQYPELNSRHLQMFSGLVSDTSHTFSNLCHGTPVKEWRLPLFVMDCDDVMDKGIFGFPSTTAAGVKALSLLRTHGVCAIVNTARSLVDVQEYCRIYGFPGGIGEYGSVIWDDLEQKAIALASEAALDQLERLRAALKAIPGIYLNSNHHYSIKAFSYGKSRTLPLPTAMIGELFSRLNLDELKVKISHLDLCVLDKSVDKGQALLKLMALKGFTNGRTGSVGDTESDFPMLRVTSQGFLVNNSDAELKRKSRGHAIEVVSHSFQKGLLQSVILFLHPEERKPCDLCQATLRELENRDGLLWQLAEIADWPRWRHLTHAFDRTFLEPFTS